MRQNETSPAPRALRRAAQLAAGCGFIVALALWIYAWRLDTTVTDSNQNLAQFWGPASWQWASIAVLSAALLSVMLAAVMAGQRTARVAAVGSSTALATA